MNTTVRPSNEGGHVGILDSIRGIAAVYVVIHHIFIYFWPPWNSAHASLPTRLCAEFFSYGRYAVAVFIVLSGYCLALPVLNRGLTLRDGIAAYLRRRARRILPPYYAILVLSLIFIGLTGTQKTDTLWDDSLALSWTGIAAHLLVVQDWFGYNSFGQINYVLWSVAVEWHIYFLFPGILWAIRKLGLAASTVGLVAVSILVAWIARGTALSFFQIQYVGLFALGVAASCLQSKTGAREWRAIILVAFWMSTGAVVVGSASIGWTAASKIWPLFDLGVGIAASAGLLYLATIPGSLIHRFLEARMFTIIGVFSYSIYLVHAPVIHAVWLLSVKYFNIRFPYSFLMVAGPGFVGSIIAAYVFHRIFERPFMNLRTASTAPSGVPHSLQDPKTSRAPAPALSKNA